jgi:2-polyprenyl-6-methoxyphenol hydroxylase-like FAD-dependent oxidoreductase
VNSGTQINNVVVIGGGTAGWMTAAGLASMLGPTGLDITLIESEAIGVVGVGEATLPHIKLFNDTIGINEAEFMAATSATFKLGIEFVDWGRKGDRYMRFTTIGASSQTAPASARWTTIRCRWLLAAPAGSSRRAMIRAPCCRPIVTLTSSTRCNMRLSCALMPKSVGSPGWKARWSMWRRMGKAGASLR